MKQPKRQKVMQQRAKAITSNRSINATRLLGSALIAALFALALLNSQPAPAGPHDIWYSASQQMISQEEAERLAINRHGGTVLASELREPNDRPPFYRVKLLSKKGEVRIVRIRANRGEAGEPNKSGATRVKQKR